MAYSFPQDLLEAQRDWYVVYGLLADRSCSAAQSTVLRRRLQRLSVRVSTHPHWATYAGRAPEARMALREVVRAEVPEVRRGV
ncbi:MAG TPA: hypothetical protein VGL02_03985 [Streptomyces sp.]